MENGKRRFSFANIALAFVIAVPFFTAGCGAKLSYEPSVLEEGQVGVAYSASVATATGADDISYSLKEGSTLPAGLSLDEGTVSGTPTQAVSESKFKVVATSGDMSAEAEFKITINAAAFAYVGGEISIEVNSKAEATVATATGATNVTYTLKSGTLPDGLTFDNGAIKGTATATGQATIVVTASATGVPSVDATWTVKVTNPKIVYENFAADAGREGAYYTCLLSKATGAKNISYALAAGSALPAGLTLETDGLLHGKPTETGKKTFNVTASAEGYDSATAEVSVILRRMEVDDSQGTITYRGGKLADGMVGELYANLKDGVNVASADNYNEVTYVLAAGSTLPAGLTMYENGTLYGTPTEIKNNTFSVTASAAGCESKTVEFTLNIVAPRVPLEKFIKLEPALVGTEYSVSLAPEDAKMEITFTNITALPEGLTLDKNGLLHGTPTKSARSATFTIKGEAAGYSSSNCEIILPIRDIEVVLGDGKMEAEYIDLTDKTGAGYSGAASQEEMVQPGANQGASNNYYIGYTHCSIVLEFKFTCSKAVKNAKIDIGLASELGTVTFTPNEFDVILNGQALDYGKFTIPGGESEGSWGNFSNFTASRRAELVEGENSIILVVKPNTFLKGQSTGGPGIDYVQILNISDAVLKWTPCLYNVKTN